MEKIDLNDIFRKNEKLIVSLVKEADDLSDKIERLNKFLNLEHHMNKVGNFSTLLDGFNIYLLKKQLKYMEAYYEMLMTRISYIEAENSKLVVKSLNDDQQKKSSQSSN